MARQHLREWLTETKADLNMHKVKEDYEKYRSGWSEAWFRLIREKARSGDTHWFCVYNLPGWTNGTSWVILCIMIMEDLIDTIPQDGPADTFY